ncbi:MAG: hypothetical protein KDK62_02625 [Chlamydiia bacterium]|nr:hypothetical protein [Chlamydiia bacterium]
MITLDCKPSSLLDFKGGRIEALQHIARGEPVRFYLDFGLERLNPHEIPAAALALDHFFEVLVPELQDYIEEVCFYKGTFPESPETFSQTLNRLAAKVSVDNPISLRFQTNGETPLNIARKSSKVYYHQFKVLVDDNLPPLNSMDATVGFLLPSDKDADFEALMKRGVDLRAIEEAYLIADWHGLNYLLVDPKYLDNESIRKLKGFQAAGGGVISLGEKIGLEEEIQFDRQMAFPHR